MPAILKAAPVVETIHAQVSKAVEYIRTKTKNPPTLATVLVGDDLASHTYVANKAKACLKLGLGYKDHKLSKNISQNELLELVQTLNEDSKIDGILVQQPLPHHLNAAEIFEKIDPLKDVDCFSPYNVGLLVQNRAKLLPCTPSGIMEIFRHYKINLEGKNALVIGRSQIVGKPMGILLLHANATVTFAHSKTKHLEEHIKISDLIITAIGKPKFLHAHTAGMFFKKTCTIIDVGINRNSENKLVGDVDFESVGPKVAAITPVPGGVGPMTIAMLMVNTVHAALIRRKLHNSQMEL